jgi:hypothetical protein
MLLALLEPLSVVALQVELLATEKETEVQIQLASK